MKISWARDDKEREVGNLSIRFAVTTTGRCKFEIAGKTTREKNDTSAREEHEAD
jgi:hypothetical protein